MPTRPGATIAWISKAISPTTLSGLWGTRMFRYTNANDRPMNGDAPPPASNSHHQSTAAPPGHCTTLTTTTAASAESTTRLHQSPRRPCGHTHQSGHHSYSTLPMCQLQQWSLRNGMRQSEVLHLPGDISHYCRSSPSPLHTWAPTDATLPQSAPALRPLLHQVKASTRHPRHRSCPDPPPTPLRTYESGYDSSFSTVSGTGQPPSSCVNSNIDDQVEQRYIRDQRVATIVHTSTETMTLCITLCINVISRSFLEREKTFWSFYLYTICYYVLCNYCTYVILKKS